MSDLEPGEWNSWCPSCKKFLWEPVMVNCNLGTEHFGERCPGCKKIRVVLEPHELRPEPDADLHDPGDF